MAAGETTPFYLSAGVILDSNGYGFVRFLPANANWQISSTSIRTNSVLQTVARTYVGQINPTSFVDATSTGNGDTSDSIYAVYVGISYWIEWTGGTPGATATATINGTATVYGGGFRAVPITG